MTTVEEALKCILSHPWIPESVEVDLKSAVGRVVAEPVLADRHLPPFDRVAMDGIAVRSADLLEEKKFFRVVGMAIAGNPMIQMTDRGVAIEVMTGAVLPAGADVVIRYEDLIEKDGAYELNNCNHQLFQNIHRCGSDAKSGEVLMEKGTRITAAEIPLLASVGKSKLNVWSLPRVALISTGDELVEVDKVPLPHQIRSSNVYALYAGLSDLNGSMSMHHLGDQVSDHQQQLERILHHADVVILTGGVSKGKLDWVPAALERLNITKHFHQVAQRPGKPLWFGTGSGKIVFALPGNPVSVFLCLYKYIRPWLLNALGVRPQMLKAVLSQDFYSDLPLTLFLQVKLSVADGFFRATPLPGGGSGDFANLRHIDGFLEIPPHSRECAAGQSFPFIPIR